MTFIPQPTTRGPPRFYSTALLYLCFYQLLLMSSTSTYLYSITVQAAALLCVFERNRNMFHLSSDIKVIKTMLKLSERAILFEVIAASARQPSSHFLLLPFCDFPLKIILSSFLFTFRSTKWCSVSSSVVFDTRWAHSGLFFRRKYPLHYCGESIQTQFNVP